MGKAARIRRLRELERQQKEVEKKDKKQLTLRIVFLSLASVGLIVGIIIMVVKINKIKKQPKSYKTGERTYSQAPDMQIDTQKKYTATIETSLGNIKIELFTQETLKTVNNFVVLARDGYYDGLKFHRIIKDFMIQGGCPKGDGTGDPGYKFEDEPITENRDYTPGIVAMANSGPNTNGSQFFIMHGDKSGGGLPKNYVIFGQVLEGMEIVDQIANVETEDNGQGEVSRPKEGVLINKVTISEEEVQVAPSEFPGPEGQPIDIPTEDLPIESQPIEMPVEVPQGE